MHNQIIALVSALGGLFFVGLFVGVYLGILIEHRTMRHLYRVKKEERQA